MILRRTDKSPGLAAPSSFARVRNLVQLVQEIEQNEASNKEPLE
jgi:hypothetical protein